LPDVSYVAATAECCDFTARTGNLSYTFFTFFSYHNESYPTPTSSIMSGREIVEQPAPLPPTLNEDGEPIKQRTVEQQNKSDNALAKDRREQGQESNRSRSSSRRDRRKRIRDQQRDGKYMHTNSLEALEEADANGELGAMHPFERIGPDSTSMDGPVTHARAMRGEIPMRGSNPDQPYYMTPEPKKEGGVS